MIGSVLGVLEEQQVWWAGDAVPATQQGWAGSAGMAPKRGWTQKAVSKWSCGKDCIAVRSFLGD